MEDAIPPARVYSTPDHTTPKKPTPSYSPQDTPVHRRLSSRVPQTSTNLYHEPAFVEAAVEMTGKFWGPVPVEDFFNKLLDVNPPPLPAVNYNKLAAVANLTTEVEMYDPLVRRFFCHKERKLTKPRFLHSSPFVKESHSRTHRLWWTQNPVSFRTNASNPILASMMIKTSPNLTSVLLRQKP